PGFIGDNNFSGAISLLANRDAGNEQRLIMQPGSIIQTTNTTANAVLLRSTSSDASTGDAALGGITITTIRSGNGGTITLDTATPTSVGNILQQDNSTVGLNAGPAGTVVLNVAAGLNVAD